MRLKNIGGTVWRIPRVTRTCSDEVQVGLGTQLSPLGGRDLADWTQTLDGFSLGATRDLVGIRHLSGGGQPPTRLASNRIEVGSVIPLVFRLVLKFLGKGFLG